MISPVLAARRQIGGPLAVGAGAGGYAAKVLSYSPIAYWPLNELSGTVADNAEGTAARDGTYSGVTLDSVDGPVAGERAGRWTPSSSYCNIYSSSLNAAINGQLLTVSAWIKVFTASVWTDGQTRRIANLLVNGSNFLEMRKNSSANMLSWIYRAGGVVKQVDIGSISPLTWVHVALTVSLAADAAKAYYAGVQVGATQTSLGSWSGSLATTGCVIGAGNTAPVNVFDGYVAQVAIFPTDLGADTIAALATP